ncbi:hypothetical protein CIK06_03290 [Plantactinospora sp. KBS50]|nr:hypothetical protein CIK06_03290 [Plantactinospora sp. KBS50]
MRPATGRRWSRLALGCAALAAAVVAVVSVVAGAFPYAVLGTGDPGTLVRVAAPLLRLTVDAAATVCTGALVFAAFFTRPQPSGLVSPPAFAALQTATRAAAAWAAAALLLWPVDAAATAGVPLRRVLTVHGLAVTTEALTGPKAWLATAAAAGALAILARRTLRWRTTFTLSAVAVLATLPIITAGHSASDTNHDIATAAIAIHIPAAVVWLGTLLALLRTRGLAGDRPAALRRYGRLSAGCWCLVAFSGLVDAAVLAPGASPVTTGYGALLLLKVALLAGLGWVVLRTRRRLLAGDPAPRRLLATELAVLALAFGFSVALTNLPAPKFIDAVVSGHQTLLGYDLTAPPTALRLIADWRVEVIFAPLCLLLAAAYLRGVRRLDRPWPPGRTVAWLAGCAVLMVTTSSGIGRYAPAMFSVETVAHMLIGMLAPLLLALGAPLTLADAALRPAPPDGLPGPREWLSAGRESVSVRTLTQPVVATVVFVATPFLLYFTAAYDLAIRYHWAHLAMDVFFLAVGYLFAWTVTGLDPTPAPAPSLLRLGVLLVAMPFDVVFGAAILASGHIIGDGSASGNMYRALDLPWVPSLADDQRLGGFLALVTSELIMFAMLAVVLIRWRPAAAEPDYQELLDELAQRRTRPASLDA